MLLIRYYKSINLELEKLDSYEAGCWINLTEPTSNELEDISHMLKLDLDVLTAALDDEESSRIESDEDYTLIHYPCLMTQLYLVLMMDIQKDSSTNINQLL